MLVQHLNACFDDASSQVSSKIKSIVGFYKCIDKCLEVDDDSRYQGVGRVDGYHLHHWAGLRGKRWYRANYLGAKCAAGSLPYMVVLEMSAMVQMSV